MQKYTENIENCAFTMIPIECGVFNMGHSGYIKTSPIHAVGLNTYYLGECVVTNHVWKTIMGGSLIFDKKEDRNKPVVNINFTEIAEFINRLNTWVTQNPNPMRTKGYYYLPSEAQWEYAARGGNRSQGFVYAGSNNIYNVAIFIGNNKPNRVVGQLRPNELGLYDMSGGVNEVCADFWHKNYDNAPGDGSAWKFDSYEKYDVYLYVIRGGSWADTEKECTVFWRGFAEKDFVDYTIGFRLCYLLY